MDEYIRKNDEKVDKLSKDFHDHLPIENAMHMELKNILIEQNKKAEEFNKKVDAHMLRVEPVIKAYEDEKVFSDTVKRKGNTVIWWSSVVGAIGYLYYLVTHK